MKIAFTLLEMQGYSSFYKLHPSLANRLLAVSGPIGNELGGFIYQCDAVQNHRRKSLTEEIPKSEVQVRLSTCTDLSVMVASHISKSGGETPLPSTIATPGSMPQEVESSASELPCKVWLMRTLAYTEEKPQLKWRVSKFLVSFSAVQLQMQVAMLGFDVGPGNLFILYKCFTP